MALQYKLKMQDSQYLQIQKQNRQLRDYNLALEKENQSKNEQQKALLLQIQHLRLRLSQTAKNQISTALDATETFQYIHLLKKFNAYQQHFLQLQADYEKMLLENAALKQRVKDNQQIVDGQRSFDAQRESFKSTIRNLQVKVYTLEAQIFSFQSEINDLKLLQRKFKNFYEDPQQIQLKVNQLQRQLFRKSQEIIKNQGLFYTNLEEHRRQKIAMSAIIQALERRLKQKQQEITFKQPQKQEALQKKITSIQLNNEQLSNQQYAKETDTHILHSQITVKMNYISNNQDLLSQIKTNQDELVGLKKEMTKKINSSLKTQFLLRQIADQQKQISALQSAVLQTNATSATNKELTLQLTAKMDQISRLKSQTAQLFKMFDKNEELQKELTSKKDQISRLKVQLRQKVSNFSPQILNLQNKIGQFQAVIRAKDEEITKVQALYKLKQQELNRLNKQIVTYINKINSLSAQLSNFDRLLQNRSLAMAKYAQNEELNMLHPKMEQLKSINMGLNSKIEQVNAINVSLNSAIASLERQNVQKNVHIKDFQRRVNLLEENNINLQNQLRSLIQKRRASTSFASSQKEQNVILSIRQLKMQVQRLTVTNQLLELENSQLYSQLQEFHRLNQKLQKKISKQNRQRSKTPSNRLVEPSYSTNQITFHPAMRLSNGQADKYANKLSNISGNRKGEIISPLNAEMYKNSSVPANNTHNRFQEIQKSIKRLQSENQVLRQHLG